MTSSPTPWPGGSRGTEQTVGIRYRQILVEHLLGIHNGTDLEKIEIAGLSAWILQANSISTGRRIASETILHPHLHAVRAGVQHHVGSTLAKVISSLTWSSYTPSLMTLVVGIEGRGYIVETTGSSTASFILEFQNIKSVIHLEVITYMLAYREHRTGSGSPCSAFVRPQKSATPGWDDKGIYAQGFDHHPQVVSCPVLRARLAIPSSAVFVTYRIIVERTEHATHRGIETGAIVITHHLLQG